MGTGLNRIYSNIYTKAHPQKASELIQYNHIISTIALTYTWENVYSYDKEFRMHLSKHANRSWAIILQQAWTMRLRDRIKNDHTGLSPQYANKSGNGRNVEPCRRFNRGKCNFEASCKHRCSYCGKFGHGFFNCRKAAADKEKSSKYQGNSSGRTASPSPKYAHDEIGTSNRNHTK